MLDLAVLATITVMFPWILAACGAVGAPVIIHMLMRPRPRRQVFPALRFVLKSQRANARRLKVRRLILLAMRMAVIALIALAIARVQIPTWQRRSVSPPTAAVIVLDSSASMGYSEHGTTRLAKAKAMAREYVAALPAGSKAAVISTSGPQVAGGFHSDRELCDKQISEVSVTPACEAVAGAMERAASMLAEIDLPRKEILLLTDMTVGAWRQRLAPAAKDVHYSIINCGDGGQANVAIGRISLSAAIAPVGGEVELTVPIIAAEDGGEMKVLVELDGQAVGEKTVTVAPGQSKMLRFTIRPETIGAAGGLVRLDRADALGIDNIRYFTLHAGEGARMLILVGPSPDDRTGFLMANAVAPAGGAGRWRIARRTLACEQFTAADADGVALIMLAGASPSKSQWTIIEEFVRDGGSLWVVAGADMTVSSCNSPQAQRVMPAAIDRLEHMPAEIAWRADNPPHPLLQPFAGGANGSLSRIKCYKRFVIKSLASDAQVIVRFADGQPAILSRSVGRGSVMFWTTSPAREFSNLARSAVELVVLARRTVQLMLFADRLEGSHAWGQTVSVPFPPGLQGPAITVSRGGATRDEPVFATMGAQEINLSADRLGWWTVKFAERGRTVERGFSVNVAVSESDLTPPAGEELAEFMQQAEDKQITIADDVAGLRKGGSDSAVAMELAGPLAALLVALLIVESFFANLFYIPTAYWPIRRRRRRTASQPSADTDASG